MPEIFGLASQFATQNCLGCYSKLNLGSKFHGRSCYSSLTYKIKSTVYLEYYVVIIATHLLQIAI